MSIMAPPVRIRPTLAEIDLDALLGNLEVARSLTPHAEVMAVVKANAYGHGAVPVSLALEKAGVRFFAVALVEEGLQLREAGLRAPILVLGAAYDHSFAQMVAAELIPVVFRSEHLSQLAAAAQAAGRSFPAHLKLDTGMGRIGVRLPELPGFLAELKRYPQIQLDGVLSHFANADLADTQMTRDQIARFKEAMEEISAAGLRPRYRHLSNSAGLMTLPEVRDGTALNLVRPGIMLYGASPAADFPGADRLRPVMRWTTQITHLKEVAEGTPVSYGSTWRAPRPSRIATLPVGYADGYSRSLSNKGQVLVRGQRVPVVGRVCMDMMMLDVTDVPNVQMEDTVVLLGTQGTEHVSADEIAGWMGTISYEVLCGVGARVPRVIRSLSSSETGP